MRLSWVILFYLFFQAALHAQAVYEVNSQLAQAAKPVHEYFSLYEDKTGQLGIETVSQENFQARFSPIRPQQYSYGRIKGALWVRFSYSNPEQIPIYFSFISTYLDIVELYEPDKKYNWRVSYSGDSLLVRQRAVLSVMPTFQIAPQGGSAQQTIYFRIKSPVNVLKLQALVLNERSFFLFNLEFLGLCLLCVGSIVTMLLYNVFLWMKIKDEIFIFYTLSSLGAIMLVSDHGGLVGFWLSGYSKNAFTPALFLQMNIYYIGFAVFFLDLHTLYPRLFYVLLATVLASIASFMALFLGLSMGTSILINQVLHSFQALLVLLGAILAFRKGNKIVKFYLLGALFFNITTLVFYLVLYGWIQDSLVSVYLLLIGATLESIFYSFAVADKINLIREEKENTQQQLINALEKNQELSQTQNAVLVKAVETRTRSLNQTLKKLQANIDVNNLLFGVISHDLRSPLTNLGALIPLFQQEGFATPEQQKELFQNIKLQVDKNLYLLDNLLAWVNWQKYGSKIQLNQTAVNLHELVETNKQLFQELLQRKSLRLLNQLPVDTCVLFDPEMLKVIVRNLLSNAIKFSHLDGQIVVSAQATDHNRIIVSFQDQGVGIAAERLAGLFQQNAQKSTLGTMREKGTGLGLTMVKEFLEANQGSVEVVSQVEQGTVFKINLLIAKALVE